MEIIFKFLLNLWINILSLWLEISFYLLLGMVFAGILNIFLGKDFIQKNLGKGGIGSIIKATVFGIPLPVCSCGVLPIASSLKKNGAHKSSILSFLVSTPTTGVDSIFATYSLLGPLFAIFRPVAAFVSGITVGILDYIFEKEDKNREAVKEHTHSTEKNSFKLLMFFNHAFIEIPQDIGKWLVLGTVLGGIISSVIPQKLFSSYLGFPFDFIVAFVVGVPLYVCATGSIPIAASLIHKGFSPGAGLVFLIVGPATNSVTLSFVRGNLGKKSFYIYLGSIIVIAFILGLVFNYLGVVFGKTYHIIHHGGMMLPQWVKYISSIILLGVILNAYFRKNQKTCAMNMDFNINVPDIHCNGCKLAIENKLKNLDGVEEVYVDINKKIVHIKGNINIENVIKEIKEAGYSPNE